MSRGGPNPLVVVLALFAAASFLGLGLILVEAAEVTIALGDTGALADFVGIGALIAITTILLGLIRGLMMDAV